MKYRILKDISLLTIAQAGPKGCDEFTREYKSLIYMLAKIDFAGMRYIKDDDISSTHLMRWLEEKPKRIQWLIDKGFIERVEPALAACPFHKGVNILVVDEDDRGFYVSCGRCGARGPHTPSKRYSIADWNRRP